MKNTTWKWALVAFLVAWSLWELYPPTNRNLIEVFKSEAVTTDAGFSNIVQRAETLQKEYPDRNYLNLREAVGTNDLRTYFTTYDVSKEKDPNLALLNHIQRKAAGKIKLGLDLRGGTSFLMGMDTSAISTNMDKSLALSQAVEVLRRRVDRLGVAEPLIQPAGEDRILVQLPGISEADKESAREQLQKAAFLELRLVHPQSRELLAQGIVEPGYEKMTETDTPKDRPPESYLVRKKAELTGDRIKQAMVVPHQVTGKPQIDFVLDQAGADIFARVTRENVGNQLAIILDNELYSAPNINEAIETGRAQITGNFTREEAWNLANALENPLQAPVKIMEERSVDPSLGKDSIRSGRMAAIVGVVGISIFMLIYYLAGGVVANVALILNIIILFGVMCSIGTTLTLPGIAGIVLTLGMAVDANVLIFERIREELATGKSIRGAVSAGYDRAFGTIFDSNITTLIASVILIYMGTGPVKGFGVTLTIGVTVSMFTALVVTRLMFDWLLAKNMLKQLKMLHVIGTTNINFMNWKMPVAIASVALIVIGLGYGVYRGKDVLGVDFAGGDTVTLHFAKKIPVDELRETIAGIKEVKVGEPMIQYQKEMTTTTENLRITTAFDTGSVVEKTLQQKFPDANFTRIALDKVGATVGEEIQKAAVIATLVAMFGILIYVAFRYEFSFSIGAIVAIVHDVAITMGIFFLSGRQLSAPMVAAVLTIIGFSINDTIVIFDRIREDLKMGMRGTFAEIINKAVNQTLSRTIITSGTVLLATLSLYIFGGSAINDFAFTFMVGILVGTYSSVYISSATVWWWHKGERPKMAAAPAAIEGAADASAKV